MDKVYEFLKDRNKVYSIKLFAIFVVILALWENESRSICQDILNLLDTGEVAWIAQILSIIIRLQIIYSKLLVGIAIAGFVIMLIVEKIEKKWEIDYEQKGKTYSFMQRLCRGCGHRLMNTTSDVVLLAILFAWCGGELEMIFNVEVSFLNLIFISMFGVAFLLEICSLIKMLLERFFSIPSIE